MSDSVQPHRRQPTRLLRPWYSPGKNTGVGCHFLFQCMKVKSESEVAQSCPTLHDPVDCSPPGFSIYEIFRARVLEWGTIAFSQEVPVVSFKIKKEFSNFIPFQDCFSYLGSLPISYRSFLIGQLLKNPPAMWKTWVRSLGWEDPLEKRKATHSSIMNLRIRFQLKEKKKRLLEF